VAACSSGSPSPAPSAGAPSVVQIRTGVNPASIAIGGASAWIANAGEGTVSKVDVATNRIVATVPIGDPKSLAGCQTGSIHQTPHGDFRIRDCDLPKGVAAGKGAAWAGRGDTKALVRIDPATARVVASIPVGVEPWYVVATDTAVWLDDWRTNTVVRVDPATNQVVARLTDLPAGPTGLAVTPDAVWVASSRANMLTRIDPGTNQVVASVATDLTPLAVASAFGAIWVRNHFREGNGSVQRIDPATNQVAATIPIGPDAGRDGIDALAPLGDRLWVAGLLLEAIDPKTNQVVRRVNHTCNAVAPGAGALWTVDITYAVSRIKP
jgi:YVTN family beta-propeller protein